MKPIKIQPLAIGVLQLAVIVASCYAIYLIKSVLVYAVIALYISVLGRPIVSFIGKIPKIGLRIGNTGAAALTLSIIVTVFAGIVTWFLPVLAQEFNFIKTIPYDELIASLQLEWNQLDAILTSFGMNSKEELTNINETLQSFASVDAISNVFFSLLGGIGQIIIGLFSVAFISFFLIRERDLAHKFVDLITPESYHDKVDVMTPQIKQVVTRYSFGVLFQITAVFILLGLGMTFIGVKGAVVLALCAAVFNLIPYVGPLIGASLGILLSLGQLYAMGVSDPSLDIDLVQSLYWLLLLFGGVQLLDNIVFQPIIFSNSVGAHPLEIFLVISIAGTFLGIGGMIIAVPFYSVARIVFNTAMKSIDE